MRSRIGSLSIVVGLLVVVLALTVSAVLAGDPEPSGPPDATDSYTLADIYERLDAGVPGAQSKFTEPATAPGTGTMYDLNEIMAKAPAADDAAGAAPASVLVGKTYWGLRTDGGWGPQTGTRPPAPVAQTGQTQCYSSTIGSEQTCPVDGYPGQDGELQAGVVWPDPRFQVGASGVVTDQLTGLVWLRSLNCISSTYPGFDLDSTAGDGQVTWQHALEFVAGMTATGPYSNCAAGYSDWRLPQVKELYSVIDLSEGDPALPDGHPFTGWQQSTRHWTGTTVVKFLDNAWSVGLSGGCVIKYSKGSSILVWPVRGGK